jgi:hypothetical protein
MKNIEYGVEKTSGLSKARLDRLLTHWQKKLNMTDWEISISIVNFKRKDFKQSGDFEASIPTKKAKILLTAEPFRRDEEYTLVHELLHVLLYNFDKFLEDILLKDTINGSEKTDDYMGKLENITHHLTEIILGRSCSH